MERQEPGTSGYYRLFTVSFTALLAGQVMSIFGDRLNNIALIELLSQETGRFTDTGATFELSKLALAITLPSILLGPYAGALIDRLNKKRVLIISDVVRGLVVLAIPFLRPHLPLWTVYGAVAVLYFTNLFFLPARCAIVPEIVPRQGLLRANSMLSLGATVASIVGFSVGGVAASWAGWRTALFIDSATYLISAAALAMISLKPAEERSQKVGEESYLHVIRAAAAEIRKVKATRAGVLAPSLLVVAATVAYVLGVAVVESRSVHGTMVVGFLVSVAGAGMAVGCYFAGKRLQTYNRVRVILTGTPIAAALLAVVGLADRFLVLGMALAAAGFAAGPVFVTSETIIQEQATRKRQATVFALRDMLMKVCVAVAATLAPAVATLIGLRMTIVVMLLGCSALSFAILERSR